MSNKTGSAEIRCDQCGITFTTLQDREEHMKLEHKEGKATLEKFAIANVGVTK